MNSTKPVSYTHLDVYKRQVLHKALKQAVLIGYLRTNPTEACILPRIIRKEMHPLEAVSYTHLDVYKRQRQDYVRTARAKGASERTVIWKHVLKNCLLYTSRCV